MSYQPEQPFHERESRYFLAEILKTSEVPLADLVKTIQDRNIAPQWEHMALPNGRSLAACRQQFNLLTNRVSSFLTPVGPAEPPSPSHWNRQGPPRPGQIASFVGEPPLQPQQFQFAPINEPSNPTVFHTSPYAPTDTADKSGKKRGRPSKAEREYREAEARARGEVYQPTKRRPKKSTEAVEGAEPSTGPGAKKPVKRQKVEPDEAMPPVERQSEEQLSPATPAGDSMQLDTPERQPRSGDIETGAPDFTAAEGLVADLRREAAQTVAQVTSSPAAGRPPSPAPPVPGSRAPQPGEEAGQSSPEGPSEPRSARAGTTAEPEKSA